MSNFLGSVHPDWGVFRVVPILLTILVTVGTVMYKQDNEQDNK